MFKSNYKSLPTLRVFWLRLLFSIMSGFVLILIALGIGMWGYHFFGHLPWVDAFQNASMILSGMGPVNTLTNDSAKIFAGLYALFSGLIFIMVIGLIFAPIIHRFFHSMHLELAEKSSARK